MSSSIKHTTFEERVAEYAHKHHKTLEQASKALILQEGDNDGRTKEMSKVRRDNQTS